MAHMRTQMDLITKHIMAGSKKVNGVGTPNRYADQDIDLDEEDKYLGNQGGFHNYNSRNRDYNSGNAGQNYSREGQYDKPANRDEGNWQNRDGYSNDRKCLYVAQVIETVQVVVPAGLSRKICWLRCSKRLSQLMQG
ncbi:hypothetical protein KY285_008040 [Solanum tuberosum]|nr:hypothetical protein KY285_008040 [Solanum tuberosum]